MRNPRDACLGAEEVGTDWESNAVGANGGNGTHSMDG